MTTPTVRMMVVGTTPGAYAAPLVPRDFRAYNNLVGGPAGPGSISGMRLPQDLLARGFRAYCDDDAIARRQAPNPHATNLGHYRLQGPIVIFRDNGDGEEHDLTVQDVEFLTRYLGDEPTAEAYGDALQDQLFWAQHPSGQAIYELDDNFEIVREIT